MKRVLFIAEMNEIVKNMNEAMLPYFQVQLCIADAGMTAGVVNAIAAYHLELLQEQARLKI